MRRVAEDDADLATRSRGPTPDRRAGCRRAGRAGRPSRPGRRADRSRSVFGGSAPRALRTRITWLRNAEPSTHSYARGSGACERAHVERLRRAPRRARAASASARSSGSARVPVVERRLQRRRDRASPRAKRAPSRETTTSVPSRPPALRVAELHAGIVLPRRDARTNRRCARARARPRRRTRPGASNRRRGRRAGDRCDRRTGTTTSEREAESQAMCPGNFSTSSTTTRAPLRGRRPAHALAERDLEASERALIRSDAQQRWPDHPVEAGPQVAEAVVQHAADRRHGRDLVVHPVEERVELRLELRVMPRACRSRVRRASFRPWRPRCARGRLTRDGPQWPARERHKGCA